MQIERFYLRNYAAFAIQSRDGSLLMLGNGASRLCRGDRIVPLPFAGEVKAFDGFGRGGRPQRNL